MPKLLYLWGCWLALAAQAQDAGLACGNGRYADDIFPTVRPAATVVFGYTTIRDYATETESAPVPLRLDVPEPAGDAATQRPLLLVAFGGSFSSALGSAAPLPVVLTSFSGSVVPEGCLATLTWQTAAERNSYAYEVQASADGQAFAPLGTVPSKNRAAGAAYSYRVGPLAGPQYFRLRLLDADGLATYSPVVALAPACAAGPLLVAPNPVRDQATVSGLPPGRSQLLLYNASGQCVVRATGEGSATLHLGALPPGVYLLRVLSAGGTAAGSLRLTKE